jgi:mannonate dehydratase
MEKTWRWFGANDRITLAMLRQIGVEGIVTALHSVPNGEVWTLDAILSLKRRIEAAGLRWSVVESLPVSEAIKYAGDDRDRLLDNYCVSLANLAKAGIRTVCYNFMPVIDWIRTDLEHPADDGTTALYFSRRDFACFDCCILQRPGAFDDYAPDEQARIAEQYAAMTDDDRRRLIDNIIVRTQGFVNGNTAPDGTTPVEYFRRLLDLYRDIDRDALRRNLRCFLEYTMPVCDRCGIDLCIHPDDPPQPLLGLPRIVACDDDIRWLLDAVDNPHNGLTFCAGSLSSGAHNDVVELARKYAARTRFVHLRSAEILANGDFVEAPHLKGRGHLIELVRIFEHVNPRLPMRVDHGRTLPGDENRGYNPGYTFYGRMYALAQIDGVMETVRQYES